MKEYSQDKEIKKSELNEDISSTSEEVKEESKKESSFMYANSKGSICIVCYSASLACWCIRLWEVVNNPPLVKAQRY